MKSSDLVYLNCAALHPLTFHLQWSPTPAVIQLFTPFQMLWNQRGNWLVIFWFTCLTLQRWVNLLLAAFLPTSREKTCSTVCFPSWGSSRVLDLQQLLNKKNRPHQPLQRVSWSSFAATSEETDRIKQLMSDVFCCTSARHILYLRTCFKLSILIFNLRLCR